MDGKTQKKIILYSHHTQCASDNVIMLLSIVARLCTLFLVVAWAVWHVGLLSARQVLATAWIS